MTDAASLRREWIELLGAQPKPDASVRVGVASVRHGVVRRDVEVHSFGLRLTLRFAAPGGALPRPVVVLPFYDTHVLFGEASALYPDPDARPTRAFAQEFLAAGFGVLAVPWWAETLAAEADPLELHARYGPIAAEHQRHHPEVTGLGRSVADLRLAVDALAQIDEVDSSRIGVFGHSLGGKLALFSAALDPRIAAAVTHEPGLGFAHSNWSDPWYFGERVPCDRDLDQVLGLVSPRPVLYAGGGASDGAHNAEIAHAASRTDSQLSTLHHTHGHPLPDEVLAQMIAWLWQQLDV